MATARRLISAVLTVAILVGGWTFAHRNQTGITIDYWFGQWSDVSLWLVLMAAFAAGAGAASLVWGLELAKSGLAARRYRAAMKALEEEVHQLRNLPLASGGSGDPEGTGTEDPALALDSRAGGPS